MQTLIEPADEADLQTIAELARGIWLAHYPGIITIEQIEYMLSMRYNRDALLSEITTPGHALDKLIVDDAIVGLANYYRMDNDEMKLDKLYLQPAFHGRGVGSLLIEHVAQQALARGCHTLKLNVNKRNLKAIRAYERNGFVAREAVVVDIGQGFVMDDYVMVKALS